MLPISSCTCKSRAFCIFSLFLVFLQIPELAFAIDSEANREAIVAPRSKKFYKSSSAKKYLSFGGNYASDYNSKKYELVSRYLFQSDKQIHEINFQHQTDYADSGSGKNKKYGVKKSELYDLSIASKARILDSENYGVFFHRSIYDELSKYYYDSRTALGLGRMFFNDKIEFDLSLGYQDVKAYGYKVDAVASFRSNFKLSPNITLIQRGYAFLDHESMDNQLNTSLVYRINNKLSFEIRHNFETRRYEADDENRVANFVNRSVTIGLIFDLN